MQKRFLLLILLVSGWLFSGCNLAEWRTKAGLQVITNDVASTVYMDGKLLAKTPYIDKELEPGEYTIEITPDDPQLQPHQTKIQLRRGLLTVITWKPGTRAETSGGVIYEMEPLHDKKNSELSINTIPDGVIVHVDKQAHGFSPVLIEKITPGEHEYEVTLPSYETQRHTINVLAGYRMNVSVKLAKQDFEPTSPSATPTPSTQPSPSPILSATGSALVSPSTQPVVLPRPKVVIKPTGFLNAGKEVLRVRSTASSSGKELGFAPVGTEYPYLNVTEGDWYKIQFNGQEGWVSSKFADLLE